MPEPSPINGGGPGSGVRYGIWILGDQSDVSRKPELLIMSVTELSATMTGKPAAAGRCPTLSLDQETCRRLVLRMNEIVRPANPTATVRTN